MRERERQREGERGREGGRKGWAIHMLLIHSIFVVAFIFYIFFLYFTSSIRILHSLQN